jgi:hypothetical protein
MRPRIKGAWIAAGIAVLGAMIAGGQARAGTVGITISGGEKPVIGDPPYDYIFQVYLDPGFEVLATGSPLNDFQVTGLVGVGADSFTSQPTTVPWTPTPATGSVTWTLFGTTSIPNTGTGEQYLGQFSVLTDKSFSSPPVTPGTTIVYNFTVYDISTGKTISGSNSFTLVLLGVPEPSSVVLLTLGAAAVPAIAARRRRHRMAQTA